jgi:alpha-D-xyloside xylohydrolase
MMVHREARRLLRRVVAFGCVASLSLCAAHGKGTGMAIQAKLVAPGVWRVRLGAPEKFVPTGFRTAEPRLDGLQGLPACDKLPFDARAIRFRASERGCAVDLPMTKDEQIFGFGMNMKVLNATGMRRSIRVSEIPNTDFGDTHGPAPFYVSTAGYGVYVDTARYAQFWCGNANAVDGHRHVAIDVPVARGVDVYVFGGPNMKAAVQRYNLWSGGGCLPPLWGLGVWYRVDRYFSAEETVALSRLMRERRIPCDVIGMEPGWQTKSYSCSFVWDKKGFPDPGGFLKTMGDMGYRVNLWEHAFTNPSSPIYDKLKPLSGDYMVWGGLVPDFALPATRRVFAGYHEKEIIDKGISGFKLDECDNQPLSAKPWSFPERTVFPSGLDGEQMHSLFGPLYQQTLLEPYRKRNLRTYGQVRAGWGLAAPLPYVFFSDEYDHRLFVHALVNAGFAGFLWEPEVRESESVDDLYRRVETVVFSPMCMVNAWYLRNFPWRQIDTEKNNKGEMMPGWEKAEDTIRGLFELRMKLLPYLYAAFAEYNLKGTPPFRALVMDYPKDPNTYKVDEQWMVGPSLMVAPLFAGEESRSVYLPKGGWYDFWTNEPLEGGRTISVTAPPDRIPLYVKENSILPLAAPVDCVRDDTCFEVTIRVYGAKPAPFTLYEDDGVSFGFERGAQTKVTLSWSAAAGGRVRRTGGYKGAERHRVAKWDAAAQ